jgi:hypothetical protein
MTQKIFVTDNNTAIFVCPECNMSKTADISRYKDLNKSIRLKIKCPCGNEYSVVLERRKQYRKQVNILGKYTSYPPYGKPQNGAVTVVDISRGGLGLKFRSMPAFEVGSTFVVEFYLDDRQKTFIKKEVVIRRLTGQFVGAEFCSVDTSDPSDRALGFYLF